MSAWVRGAALGQAEFAERFLGRAAAMGAAVAKSHAALAEAAKYLANAMQGIGIDRWQRFLADAQERARDPATVAAAEKSRQPADIGMIGRDAICSVPFSPVEVVSGVGAAILAGKGVAAVARAAGTAILRWVVPKTGPRNGGTAEKSDAAGGNAEQPETATSEGSKTSKTTKPSLPANPDDLLKDG